MAAATKSELTSYLNNGYDVMNYFAKFEKFIPRFMTIGSQMPELDRGFFLPPPPYKIGSQNTPYKLGLRKDTPLIRIHGRGSLSNFLQFVVK